MTTKIDGCDIFDVARKLTKELQTYPLPDTWEPGDRPYDVILAEVRHEYTNYDDLLHQLPPCEWVESDEIEMCSQWPQEWDECCLTRKAHDLLKWAAKDIAERLYLEWGKNHDPT